MAATYQLTILTPAGSVFAGAAEALVVSGREGSFGVLAHHAGIFAALVPGPTVVTAADGTKKFFATGAGVLEMTRNECRVLVDVAVPAVDLAAAHAKVAELHSPIA